jgi:hypothetical protein
MDWGTLLATGIGAVFGAGTTLVVDYLRTKRDRDHHELNYRREVCGTYLGCISLTLHRLHDLWRHGPQSAEERSREAGRILTESAGYPERQQLLMIAPGLENETARLFDAVDGLRFLVAQDPPCGEQEWENAVAAATGAIKALRDAMRSDLYKTFKYATKTNLPGKERAEITLRTAETGTGDNTAPAFDG